MFEWLLAPIDAGRPHLTDMAIAWHGRLMVLAWGVLIPLGVIAARYFKITPRQHWPAELDNQAWWRAHLALQYTGGVAMAVGLMLVASDGLSGLSVPHSLLGWSVMIFGAAQFAAGWSRGSKGGPTEPAPDGSWAGDHYDMTPRRKAFEYIHKLSGYSALCFAAATILTGLWRANAPIWMWIGILGWWAALIALAVVLERRGMAVDTYQAIWGPDPKHPGNQMKPIGWGVRRRER